MLIIYLMRQTPYNKRAPYVGKCIYCKFLPSSCGAKYAAGAIFPGACMAKGRSCIGNYGSWGFVYTLSYQDDGSLNTFTTLKPGGDPHANLNGGPTDSNDAKLYSNDANAYSNAQDANSNGIE
jgi:hypothetical protein